MFLRQTLKWEAYISYGWGSNRLKAGHRFSHSQFACSISLGWIPPHPKTIGRHYILNWSMKSQVKSKKMKVITNPSAKKHKLNKNFTSSQIMPTVEIVSYRYKPWQVSTLRRMVLLPEVKMKLCIMIRLFFVSVVVHHGPVC